MPKSVLITGCSEGTIGNGLALEFARRGWRVYATARSTAKMANLEKQGVTLLALDVSDGDAVKAARDQISKDTGGKLDILFNNAGLRYVAMMIDDDPDDDSYLDARHAAVFQTNVTATFAITRVFAPLVIAAKGTMVFNGSGYARIEAPANGAYCASKAALDMYAKVLRIEMKPLGVKVVHCVTSGVHTQMAAQRMEFPKGSRYESLEKTFNDTMDNFEKNATDVESYSRSVVGQLERKNPPKDIWAGGAWWQGWVLEKFGLLWVVPRVMSSWYGLDKSLV